MVLARRKAVLLDRICVDRDEVAAAVARLAEPIEIAPEPVWARASAVHGAPKP